MLGISPKQPVPRDQWQIHLANKIKYHWRPLLSKRGRAPAQLLLARADWVLLGTSITEQPARAAQGGYIGLNRINYGLDAASPSRGACKSAGTPPCRRAALPIQAGQVF